MLATVPSRTYATCTLAPHCFGLHGIACRLREACCAPWLKTVPRQNQRSVEPKRVANSSNTVMRPILQAWAACGCVLTLFAALTAAEFTPAAMGHAARGLQSAHGQRGGALYAISGTVRMLDTIVVSSTSAWGGALYLDVSLWPRAGGRGGSHAVHAFVLTRRALRTWTTSSSRATQP